MFGERAFCEIRMFKLFAQRHKKMEAKKCFRSNENENKQCEQVKNLSGKQVLQVENRYLLLRFSLQMMVWEKNVFTNYK